MDLTTCLRTTTHRQYRSWNEWIERQWDRPSRADLYLMQIAMAVRQGQVKTPADVRLEDFRLKFRTPSADGKNSDAAKSRWMGAVGMSPRRYTTDRPPTVEEVLYGGPGLFVPPDARPDDSPNPAFLPPGTSSAGGLR